MKKLLLFGLSFVLCLCLSGCGSDEIVNANDGNKDKTNEKEHQTEPGIAGYVIKKEDGRVLVISAKPKDFSSTGGLEEFYSAIWVSNVSKDVKTGQKVKVWFAGPILESYPGQGEADKASIVPGSKPEGASLSEAQALRKALAKQKGKTTGLTAIKAVKYNKKSDTWSILMKDTQTENEFNVQVKDR